MAFFKWDTRRGSWAVVALGAGLLVLIYRTTGETSVGNQAQAGLARLASMKDASAAFRDIVAGIAIVLGSTVALRTYLWNRRQKKTESTISVVEHEMYDDDFQGACDLLESALHNPRFSQTTPFMLPREYRNAFLLMMAHYMAVRARAKGELLDEGLYRRLLDFRLKRQFNLLEPYIRAVQQHDEDQQWGAEVLDLLRAKMDNEAPASLSGWILGAQYMIRNMSAESMMLFLESQTAQRILAPGSFGVSRWFVSEWKPSARDARVAWISGRKEEMREEILSFDLGALSWPDLTKAMERLDSSPGPTLASIMLNLTPQDSAPEDPADFTLA